VAARCPCLQVLLPGARGTQVEGLLLAGRDHLALAIRQGVQAHVRVCQLLQLGGQQGAGDAGAASPTPPAATAAAAAAAAGGGGGGGGEVVLQPLWTLSFDDPTLVVQLKQAARVRRHCLPLRAAPGLGRLS